MYKADEVHHSHGLGDVDNDLTYHLRTLCYKTFDITSVSDTN